MASLLGHTSHPVKTWWMNPERPFAGKFLARGTLYVMFSWGSVSEGEVGHCGKGRCGCCWALLSGIHSAPRWNFSLCLHNSSRRRFGWHLFVRLSWEHFCGDIVPSHHICHLELKGTLAQPSLLCGNPLVAEIRILVCKQSQVGKHTGFQQDEKANLGASPTSCSNTYWEIMASLIL